LDVASEGLLVVTSDGALARAMEHPELGGLSRRYEVVVHGRVTPAKVAALRKGLTVNGVRYKGMGVRVTDAREKRATLQLTCREGKNRMIRKLCDHLRLRVSRLKRTGFGPFKLDALPNANTVLRVPLPRSLRRFLEPPSPG